MDEKKENTFRLKVYLLDGRYVNTPDDFQNEEEAVNQAQSYGINGYYSRATRCYFPPSQILKIELVIELN